MWTRREKVFMESVGRTRKCLRRKNPPNIRHN